MDLLGLNLRFWLRAKWLKYVTRASYVPDDPIFFIHIPKTAGTSFRNMLFRLIRQEAAFPNLQDLGGNAGNYIDLGHLQEGLKQCGRNIRFLTGHYPFAAGELLSGRCQYFVFLRDPIDRTISNLLHFQRNQPDCQGLGLLEIFEKHRWHLQNLQTRFLGLSTMDELSSFYRRELNSEKMLDQALTNLEKCTFVGITEDFTNSVKIAEQLLGTQLGHELKRNVSPARSSNSEESLIAHLRAYLEQDILLYQHALDIFEKQKLLILRK